MTETSQQQSSGTTTANDAVARARARRIKLFTEVPVWKSIILMGWPAMLMMMITGAFFFCDTILAINFADDSYKTVDGVDGAHQVRMYTGAFAPISFIVVAASLLMAMGTSTRVSINLGRKDVTRAKNTIRTGSMIAMAFSFLLLPVLMFTANPWMAGQMENGTPNLTGHKIADTAMNFAWIMIAMAPFQFFNQLTGSLFRTEARNRQTLIATLPPVFLNLLLDWLFMGPGGMAIEGAAWATFISTALTSLVFVLLIFKDRKHSIISFNSMFGKFKIIPVVGILLVGVAPFFRNMAQSITQTVEMHAMTSVGNSVYAAHGSAASLLLKSTFLGVAPIFNLFFPIMFGFAQGAGPICSFNYGARNYKRVKQCYIWAMIYATGAGILIWILPSYALGGPLLNALGVTDSSVMTGTLILDPHTLQPLASPMHTMFPTSTAHNLATQGAFVLDNAAPFNQYQTGLSMLAIVMSTSCFFGFAIGGMVLLSSTDRFFQSLIASTLRGIILFFPLVYLFRYLAEHSSYEFLFWWFFPVIGALTSVIITGMGIFVIRHVANKEVSIDDRIDMVYAWNGRRLELRRDLKATSNRTERVAIRQKHHLATITQHITDWRKRSKMPIHGKFLIAHNNEYRTIAEQLPAASEVKSE